MKRNMVLLVIAMVLVALMFVGCTPTAATGSSATASASTAAESAGATQTAKASEPAEASQAAASGSPEELTLTVEELAKYNGKDGNPAYVAVDGVIYDVTNVPEWKDGEHNGYAAGNDLTEEIKNVSPHGVSKLDGVPVVGKLAA